MRLCHQKKRARTNVEESTTTHQIQGLRPSLSMYKADHMAERCIRVVIVSWPQGRGLIECASFLVFSQKQGFLCEFPGTGEEIDVVLENLVEKAIVPMLAKSSRSEDVGAALQLWRRYKNKSSQSYWQQIHDISASLLALFHICHSRLPFAEPTTFDVRSRVPEKIWDKGALLSQITREWTAKHSISANLVTLPILNKIILKLPIIQTKIKTSDVVGCVVVGQLLLLFNAVPTPSPECHMFRDFKQQSLKPSCCISQNTQFVHCDCSGMSVIQGQLQGVIFKHVRCRDARFANTNFVKMFAHRSDFVGTDFTGARLDYATIRNCDFGRILQEAMVVKSKHPDGSVLTIPRSLGRSVFYKATCVSVVLVNVSLLNCDLTCTSWTHALWQDVNACGAQCGFSNYKRCRFINCDLTGTDFTGCDMTGAEFVGKCVLRNACFTCATLAHVAFDDACIGAPRMF